MSSQNPTQTNWELELLWLNCFFMFWLGSHCLQLFLLDCCQCLLTLFCSCSLFAFWHPSVVLMGWVPWLHGGSSLCGSSCLSLFFGLWCFGGQRFWHIGQAHAIVLIERQWVGIVIIGGVIYLWFFRYSVGQFVSHIIFLAGEKKCHAEEKGK